MKYTTKKYMAKTILIQVANLHRSRKFGHGNLTTRHILWDNDALMAITDFRYFS